MAGFFPASAFKPKTTTRVPRCGACGLFRGCGTPKMEVAGRGERGLLVVGDHPTESDDDAGTPFAGKGGGLLKSELLEVGINLERDCWTTNALICHPKKGAPAEAVDYCRPNLVKTVERLKPMGILLVGKLATEAFMPWDWMKDEDSGGGLRRWEGWTIPSQKTNAWVVPTFPPQMMLGMREDDPSWMVWRRSLRKFGGIQRRPWDGVVDYRDLVEIIYDPEEAAAAVKKISRSGVVAFDYECTTLKPEGPHARIYSCSYSDGDWTFAAPWSKTLAMAHFEFVRNPKVKKVASNMKFEDRWTRKVLGIHVEGWLWDTLVNGHILDGRPAIAGLKFQSYVRLGQPDYDSHIGPLLESKGSNLPNRIKEIDLKQLLLYNGMDSLLEIIVAAEQAEEAGLHPRLADSFRDLRPRRDLLL